MNDDEILFERSGGLGLVTLNRPKALNTLTLSMCRAFAAKLGAWRADPAIKAVLVRGAGDRAFCAGGDIVAIRNAHRGPAAERDQSDFFRDEYTLIQAIHRFPKPYIALIDGIAMGGGAGISINGAMRVVTERTVFAMPELFIGLFPDVGATRFLNLCPGRIGRYLALTGARIKAGDALYAGLATHFIPASKLAALSEELASHPDEVDKVLARFQETPEAGMMRVLRPAIDRCFGGSTVETILASLAREEGEWAKTALAAIGRAAPSSVKITLAQLERGRGMSVEEALALEYRLTQHVLEHEDFFEGIRALLIDKDQSPRWHHANVAAVSEAEVESYFVTLGARELRFPEMTGATS